MFEHMSMIMSFWSFVLDENSCELDPCKNGVCIDTLDGFECKCYAGFYGETCDWNTDDCISNACENNSTCEDGILNYTCNCRSGFNGILCEIAMGKILCRYLFISSEVIYAIYLFIILL